MFYDLCLPWPVTPATVSAQPKKSGKGKGKALVDDEPPSTSMRPDERADLEKTLDMAKHLGYNVVAFNLVLPPNTFDVATLKTLNPCRDGRSPFPDVDPRFSKGRDKDGVLQLSRMTVVFDETCITGQGNGRCFVGSNANYLAEFDLLAVQPIDAASFSHACLSLSSASPSGIDIITLDLASSARLPFQLKRATVLKAVADGAVFEVVYGIAMRSSSTPQPTPVPKDSRRNVLAGARELIRITGGKGVILSSNVARCLEMRAPHDLVNLGGLLGFKPDQAKASISGYCRAVVMRAHSNRSGYRGVLSTPRIVTAPSVEEQVGQKRKRDGADEGNQEPRLLPA